LTKKNWQKNWRFTQNLDHNIGFQEQRQFFAENWRKSQKIVIITSTPVVKNADLYIQHLQYANLIKRQVRKLYLLRFWEPGQFNVDNIYMPAKFSSNSDLSNQMAKPIIKVLSFVYILITHSQNVDIQNTNSKYDDISNQTLPKPTLPDQPR
jgi:hypothetical protein